MKNYIVCVPQSVQGYQPPFEAKDMPCDQCHTSVWVPVYGSDHPVVDGDDNEWLCASCFTNKMVHNELEDDCEIHLLGEENWDQSEETLFLISKLKLDQELAWAEDHLGDICRIANDLFPQYNDSQHRAIWRVVLLMVWEIIQRRRDGLLEDEKVFDKWSENDAKQIMEFILWKPKDGKEKPNQST